MFPTADKLRLSQKYLIDTLIINGSECEPYLTCDDRLMMQEQGDRIMGGIRYLQQITLADKAFIGIEENKPAAIAAMERCAKQKKTCMSLFAGTVSDGFRKQLIEAVTGRQVPSGKLSADVGVLVQNVATSALPSLKHCVLVAR